ncbi:MAG: hypothetical protein J5762_07135 [Clostridia bacterium]|nr:hypothetical protein [Clostridia bacterium]
MKKRVLSIVIVILTAIMLLSGCMGGNSSSSIKKEINKQNAYFKGDYVEAEDKTIANEFIDNYEFDFGTNYRCDVFTYINYIDEEKEDYYQKSKYLCDFTDSKNPLFYLYTTTPITTQNSAGKTVNCNFIGEAYLDSVNSMLYMETRVSDKQLNLELFSEHSGSFGKIKTSVNNLSDALETLGIDANELVTEMEEYVSLIDNMLASPGTKVYLCGENMLKVETSIRNYFTFYIVTEKNGFRIKTVTEDFAATYLIKFYFHYYHTTDTVTLPDDLYDYRTVNYL